MLSIMERRKKNFEDRKRPATRPVTAGGWVGGGGDTFTPTLVASGFYEDNSSNNDSGSSYDSGSSSSYDSSSSSSDSGSW